MITAISWFCAEHHGALLPAGQKSWRQPSPAPQATDELAALIGRPVKYLARMTAEARACLCAASIALAAAPPAASSETGLVAAGFDGSQHADADYFRDYVAAGRSLARGNLFVYTLPTSAVSTVSIALTLTGPVMHLHDDAAPLDSLIRHATQMLEDREADRMLALWSDPLAAVCLLIAPGPLVGEKTFPFLSSPPPSPLALARQLQSTLPQA